MYPQEVVKTLLEDGLPLQRTFLHLNQHDYINGDIQW